ncbi:DNA polymerase II [Alteromonas ponticola]|uniref:DNA polymerase n=1 Tax=Alteromonas aquimaris TaxID=2998417 RepID=A0ABT3P409_9ALTE|nr:DNA polymerase II [Alteromonas aquimaris]MCW8107462.1 DNA polymerase II [Alteromonas aquimaris]
MKKGFILSKRSVHSAEGERVELWVKTADGYEKIVSEPQQNVCFISASAQPLLERECAAAGLAITFESSHLTTLAHTRVAIVRTRSAPHMRQLQLLAKAENVTLYEADIKLADRYLMERFAYGSIDYTFTETLASNIPQVRVKRGDYLPSLTSLSLDIECDEHEYLYSVALASEHWNEVIVNHSQLEDIQVKDYKLTVVNSEKDLLKALCHSLKEADPDIILGWNVKQFDFTVLDNRAKACKVKLRLGRDNSEASVTQWSSGQTIVEIAGRCVIDGIEALKSMAFYFESFSLQYVASKLLGKRKLVHEEDQVAAIKHLYQSNPLKLSHYNFQDCVLVNEIAAHTELVDYLVLRARLTGLELSRPGGSVAAFLNLYLPRMHRAGYVCGVRPPDGGLASPGGYVMSSIPGLYKNVLVLDFKSLYPSIIRTFKIDPVGLAEGLANPDKAIEGFKGAKFSRNTHFLPDIITQLWRERDEAKKANDQARSQAIKILMNSFYGVLGSGGCPLYDPRLASSITLRGHDIMQQTKQWIEEAGYKVIYGDTDSTFVHIGDNVVSSQAKQIGLELANMINHRWTKKLKTQFTLQCHLEIEFETQFQQFFMPTIRNSELGSKKRYAGMIETAGKQQLVFKGLENVRSDWTSMARAFQHQLYESVFNKQPVQKLILTLIKKLKAGELDEKLVYSKRLRKPTQQYVKNVPPHVRAAKMEDKYRLAQGLPLKYNRSTVVKYVMTVQGPQTVASIHSPLDYDHYVEKQIKPIAESILPVVGIDFEKLITSQLGLF